MKCFIIEDTRRFMGQFLKSDSFDFFSLRSAQIVTFATFTIDGYLQKAYFPIDKQEALKSSFCLWKDLRPTVFTLIKGQTLPKSMKFVFSLPEEQLSAFDNAAALFLNLTYENKITSLTTGCAQKNFSLDKSLDLQWDSYVASFLKEQKIFAIESTS